MRKYIGICCMFIFALLIAYPAQNFVSAQTISPPATGMYGGPSSGDMGVVGDLKGTYSVSPSGAMVYTIPLMKLTGINGMDPDLSIVYNSQAGIGLLGLGWNIAGISSIHRVPQNHYMDGCIDGISYDAGDRLALDGNRLIPATQTTSYYPLNGATGYYITESQTFSEIKCVGNPNTSSSPLSFTVRAKNGLIYEYGHSMDSKIEAPGSSNVVMAWMVNRICDRSGNCMRFVYDENNTTGEVTIKYIEYTLNASMGLSPFYRVEFFYTNQRTDFAEGYTSGYIRTTSKLLDKIEIQFLGPGDPEPLFTYQFEYDASTKAPYFQTLKSIVFSGVNQSFNPFEVQWSSEGVDGFGATNNSTVGFCVVNGYEYNSVPKDDSDWWNQLKDWIVSNFSNPPPDPIHRRIIGDVDGNGFPDIIGVREKYIEVSLNNGTSFSTPTVWLDSTGNSQTDWEKPAGIQFHLGDANGDGLADLFIVDRDRCNVYLSNGLDFVYFDVIEHIQVIPACFVSGFVPTVVDINPIFVRDINGDGRTDVIQVFFSGYHSVYVSIATDIGYDPVYAALDVLIIDPDLEFDYENDGIYYPKHVITTGDFNGDGMADIIVFGEKDVELLLSDGSNFIKTKHSIGLCWDQGWRTHRHERLIADVNGDGLDDIIGFGESNTYVALSTGIGFKIPQVWYPGFGAITGLHHNLYTRTLADMNGDGMADIAVIGQAGVGIALSTGETFESAQTWTGSYSNNSGCGSLAIHPRFFVDLNGDRAADIIGFGHNNFSYSYSQRQVPLVSRVISGLDEEVVFSYKYLTDNAVYQKGTGSSYPFCDIVAPIRVLSEIETDADESVMQYEGGILHHLGKGFLGFSKIEKYYESAYPTTTRTTIITASLHATLPMLLPEQETEEQNGILIRDSRLNHYTTINQANKSFWTYPDLIFTRFWDAETNMFVKAVKTVSVFDQNGNQTLKGEYITEDATMTYPGTQGTSTIYYPYQAETTRTFSQLLATDPLFVPVKETTTRVTPFSAVPDKTEVGYDYYPAGNPFYPLLRLVSETNNDDVVNTKQLVYTYDGFGNTVEVSTNLPNAGGSLVPKLTKLTYSPNGRFCMKKARILSNQTSYNEAFTYDEKYGLLMDFTDPNNLTTEYEYDQFLRGTRQVNADGTELVTAYRWCINTDPPVVNAPQNAIYYSWVCGSGSKPVMEYFSPYKQLLRTETAGFDGSAVFSDKLYFQNGLLQQESEPYFLNQNQVNFISYQYSSTHRMNYQTFPSFIMSYQKTDPFTFVQENLTTSQQTTSKYNVLGQLTESTDAVGSVWFAYDNAGNEITMNALNSNQIDKSYDLNGNLTDIIDPDAGNTHNTYNPWGLLQHSDSPNGSFEFVYDELDRLIKKEDVNNDWYIEYTYDSQPNGIGKIASIKKVSQNQDVHEITYSYDNFGRVSTTTEVIDGSASYVTSLFYDVHGRVSEMVLPTGIRLAYTYNLSGYPDNVFEKRNGLLIPLWERIEADASDRTLEYRMGGNIYTVQQVFDALGYIETINSSNNSSVVLQNLAYAFDQSTGNLISKTDVNHNVRELYKYDNLDRLTQYTVEQINPVNQLYVNAMVYDENRIDTKSDYGDYSYLPGPANRLQNITNLNVQNLNEDLPHTIEYNSFNKVTRIASTTHEVIIEYGINGQRLRSTYKHNNQVTKVRTYLQYFTSHEHLLQFDLINMNGRVYDPRSALFLSPDPYIQNPSSTLSHNRYSYCFNNPLKYTDPSGEIFGTIFTAVWDFAATIFTKGGLEFWNWNGGDSYVSRAWRDFDPSASWSKTNKAWRIDLGLMKTDPNRTFFGRGFQLFSRFTWELPKTVVGNLASHTRNVSGHVDNVDYYGGATLVNDNDPLGGRWGFTLGSYINSKNVLADPFTDELFRHEYGHTLQSRLIGPIYLFNAGLPSLLSATLDYDLDWFNHNHDRSWFETQANRMSFRYFSNHEPNALSSEPILYGPRQGPWQTKVGTPWDDARYPRRYNPTWFWLFSVPFPLWLLF